MSVTRDSDGEKVVEDVVVVDEVVIVEGEPWMNQTPHLLLGGS